MESVDTGSLATMACDFSSWLQRKLDGKRFFGVDGGIRCFPLPVFNSCSRAYLRFVISEVDFEYHQYVILRRDELMHLF
ncbi:hypothetical protein CEXT_376331 [Caerostris extrusa]|uniref:Uncharacterized protein n=1 Tax=Caerostris extrusa TaxID=172846 RepID=A0AAV4NGX6_CAEEX|nr:hypothetical protein CEXT_376331 [Caerostris extrusa]